jgi:hypothetical protein
LYTQSFAINALWKPQTGQVTNSVAVQAYK